MQIIYYLGNVTIHYKLLSQTSTAYCTLLEKQKMKSNR